MKPMMIIQTVLNYLLVIWFIVIGCFEEVPDVLSYIPLIMIAVSVLFSIANIIFAIASKKTKVLPCAKTTMVCKCSMIVFHIINFILAIIIGILGVFSVITIFWLASLPLLFVAFLFMLYGYLMILSSSANLIFAFIRHRKRMNQFYFYVFIVLLCLPVLDVFASVYIDNYVYNNRKVFDDQEEPTIVEAELV